MISEAHGFCFRGRDGAIEMILRGIMENSEH